MFDFAWSEMAVIAAVALVLIGPKDMPVAIRSITGMIKKARRMAGEFQTHVDEMLREANLDEVKSTFNEIRNFDLKTEMERHVDPDGSLRGTFADNPLDPTPSPTPSETAADAVPNAEALTLETMSGDTASVAAPPAPACTRPAFMPPGAAPPAMPNPAPDDAAEPPAFVPPEVVSATRARHASLGNAHLGSG
ncbi:MAG TPA: Sec-independent protein translocase protein TatB [Acetobacteraceae bacterium]|jgi:sec-independent protein translocase protein TatB|nr:Sec-independent protein translocase protein TatB [Acetobacteraceae bacterium]